jgi:recombination DNA repair RAD52 pathway protein
LSVTNATRTNSVVVAEFNTANMHTVTSTNLTTAQPTDINAKVPLPLQTAIAAGEDSYIQLHFKSQSVTTTVDQTNFSIGITVVQ